jgi:hypothetical protein
VLGLASLAAFLVTTPYALFDSRDFLRDVLREVRHYATSHRGRRLDPGIPVLAEFGGLLQSNFGSIPLAIALFGAALAAWRDLRTFAVLFSFPLTFTLYMSAQRVFFARNAVSLPLFVGLALAYGLHETPALIARYVAKKPRFASMEAVVRRGVTLALLAFTVAGLPWSNVAEAYRSDIESRNDAVHWIRKNVAPGTKVLVDASLDMYLRPLRPDYRLEVLADEREIRRATRARDGSICVLKAPARGTRAKRRLIDAEAVRFGSQTNKLYDPRLEIHRL